MKKFAFILPLLFITSIAAASIDNPFFRGYRHQVGFSIGAGVNSGIIVPPPMEWVPFAEFHIQYSVPATIFYFPARFSINITQTVGWDSKYDLSFRRGYSSRRWRTPEQCPPGACQWRWQDYTIPIIYLSLDVALWHNDRWFVGVGPGVGMQGQENERIGSKLVFIFKPFIGYRINDRTAIEFYIRHFSNGNTAPENNSYAFYGISITRNF